MTMVVKDINDQQWTDFVGASSQALPFHHPSWAQLLGACYGYRPFALALTDANGGIRAGLPMLEVGGPLGRRRWLSLPFTDYCPVLSKDLPAEELTSRLADTVRSSGISLFELRAGLPQQDPIFTHTRAVRHVLTLAADPHDVYRQFSKMHQRNIRKAERAGVQIQRGATASDVETFYRLHLLTRQRLGVPIQPRRYFRLLAEHFIERGLGFVLSARMDDVPVAAAVFLAWNGTMMYKYGASDARFWEHRPNNLLFREAIRWGCENGYHTLDWGRTDLDDQGLREFKSGWGALEEPLTYSVIGSAPASDSSSGLRKAVKAVIQRSPLWVCQVIGECLYRFAA